MPPISPSNLWCVSTEDRMCSDKIWSTVETQAGGGNSHIALTHRERVCVCVCVCVCVEHCRISPVGLWEAFIYIHCKLIWPLKETVAKEITQKCIFSSATSCTRCSCSVSVTPRTPQPGASHSHLHTPGPGRWLWTAGEPRTGFEFSEGRKLVFWTCAVRRSRARRVRTSDTITQNKLGSCFSAALEERRKFSPTTCCSHRAALAHSGL